MSDRRRKTYRAVMLVVTILLGLNLVTDLTNLDTLNLNDAATASLVCLNTVLFIRLTDRTRQRGDV